MDIPKFLSNLIVHMFLKILESIIKNEKKKSSGGDGISHECLLLGAEILTIPLTRLINTSIDSGIYPEEWKKVVVTPSS